MGSTFLGSLKTSVSVIWQFRWYDRILRPKIARLTAEFRSINSYEPKGRGFESLLAYQINRLFRKK